jgi:exosortase/archaeosortase family protein
MAKKDNTGFRTFLTDPKWEKVRGILWFCLITVVIHFGYRIWANNLNFAPITGLMTKINSFLAFQVYQESAFLGKDIFKWSIIPLPDSSIIINNFKLIISLSSSGLKPMLQFTVLMLIIPGPWKNKAWFIPIGIIVIHLTNVLRIICFIIILRHWPQQIEYAHYTYLRLLFYIVIFGLWVVWVEKISITKHNQTN